MVELLSFFLRSSQLKLFSYTPLIITIQQMLEYDNVNRLSDGKVCFCGRILTKNSFCLFSYVIVIVNN